VNGIRLCFILLAILALPGPGWAVTIHEIRIDQPGADVNEYFELAGAPGESQSLITSSKELIGSKKNDGQDH